MKPILTLLSVLLAALPLPALAAGDPPAWREPAEPFRIVGNIFYVGSKGLAAYLIATPDGAILIDGTLENNVPMIERNIDKLGYRMRDVKILLNNHAHFDHAEGLAHLKRDSGAKMIASWEDARALESGTPPSDMDYGVHKFVPVKVDRTIKNGSTVKLGGVELKAVLTPGHTPGCTTWTMTTEDRGRKVKVAFLGSITVAGSKLVGNKGYPGVVNGFRLSFARLDRLHADVVLPFHPELNDLMGREAARQAGNLDAFEHPGELQAIVAKARDDFETDLIRQRGK
ncbi:subclass B3 metallo-beta-lactamase [Sphingomonas sp. MMS24-J13]|uniref:subclass B3 metallo-beta-lactamase n=1 Tax=Sphingomonas sp. MMS24-J13 TaxID=3238686 RepID=UPI00384AD9E6